ncbi:MAG: hypothetical protein WC515_05910 [Candidatus Omnitrophota bacterium]
MRRTLIGAGIALLILGIGYRVSGIGSGVSSFAEETAPANTTGTTEAKEEEQLKFVGTFYDTRVPEQNYFFIKSVISVFGNKFGKQPKTPEEVEEAVWDQLLMSYEAFRRGITVNQEEVDGEVDKILQAERVAFDRKSDRAGYEKWVKEKTNEPIALFENQIRHMIQLQRLKEEVMKAIEPEVTDAEALQGFLNENSSLDVELVQYDLEKDAGMWYNKAIMDPASWDKEKAARPKDFRRPGGVTCQFLIDFWGIPEKALQEMVRMKPGEFHKPEPIYKGWGVFKVLGSTAADGSKFEEVKERYREKVKAGKRYTGYGEWFEKFKKDANIQIYPAAVADGSQPKNPSTNAQGSVMSETEGQKEE